MAKAPTKRGSSRDASAPRSKAARASAKSDAAARARLRSERAASASKKKGGLSLPFLGGGKKGKDLASEKPDKGLQVGSPSGGGRKGILGPVKGVLIAMVAVIVVAAISLFVLSNTPVFTITAIDAVASEHLDEGAIARLAAVPEGTTLFNYDADAIEANLMKNPWVAAVHISREFPDKIRIEVVERSVSAVVLMGSGDIAWYLGSGNVWIEPAELSATGEKSARDVALGIAQEHGCILITDVPSTVTPQAGKTAEEDEITVVNDYLEGFSGDFSSQIVSFSVPSAESCSCILASGVEVSLGASTEIAAKEAVIQQLLQTYEGQLTFINVRVPSRPSVRKIDSDSVQPGTGITTSDDSYEDSETDSDDSADDDSSGDGEDSSDAEGDSSEGDYEGGE